MYSTRSKYLKHEWFVSQAEISTNVKFKSARFCTAVFEKLLQKILSFGLPDSICQIFGKRRTRKGSKSTWKVYNVNVEGVSLVTNYRSEFDKDVKEKGMDGLIAKIRNKN